MRLYRKQFGISLNGAWQATKGFVGNHKTALAVGGLATAGLAAYPFLKTGVTTASALNNSNDGTMAFINGTGKGNTNNWGSGGY